MSTCVIFQESVRAWLPDLFVVPTLAAVRNASEITRDFIATMPHEYVVKGAHGAGMVLLVRGEQARDVTCGATENRAGIACESSSRLLHHHFVASRCRHWLSIDYGRKYGEAPYSHVPPCCLFEASLLDEHGTAPRDVKVFVMHGEPIFLYDTANRFGLNSNQSRTRHVLVDTTGRALPGGYGGNSVSYATPSMLHSTREVLG